MEYWKEQDDGSIRKAKLCVANFAKRTHGHVRLSQIVSPATFVSRSSDFARLAKHFLTNLLPSRQVKLFKCKSSFPADVSSGEKVLSEIAKF